MADIVFSLAALVISLLSLAFAVRSRAIALKTTVVPTLVFACPGENWVVENIGNGPALNVVLYVGDIRNWKEAKQCYPLPARSRLWFPEVKTPRYRLGASYEDIHGVQYTSICTSYHTAIYEGQRPAEWAVIVPEVEKFLSGREPVVTG